ncbi:MAG: efflux RND transporter periplasmic adaptor subunit [Candidatus Accumulibacter sp.]|uniref:Efflux RND transporter periplasmic adaptor subunit n=1 Tax=Candidatus Accumulibacter proximus TaxID=2954385 RepID=A0A935Q039_9PROT|nr:efflux RND transporter periplasmic adaptor subunit [Candidatus Accumulibacter proximus]
MPRRSLLVLAAVATLAAALLTWWLTRAPTVPAVTLQIAPLVRTLQFSARVATFSRVDVGSTLTGRVLVVAVDEGAQVRQGEVLVRLETDELRAALAQAQANERQAAARLAGLRSTGRSSAQAAVAQADSVLVAALADLQRTQSLVARGFLSAARLDEARRAADVARAQQASARAQLAANAEQGTEVVQAQAQVALAGSATAAAQARLAQAVLTAPADARVLARLVEPGQIVQPGHALLSLALAGPLQLVAQVDERYLEQLQVGQTASVLADAFPGQRFSARVLSISPLVDAQRGAIEVKFSLPEAPPAFLREDMTLSVEVETARRQAALVVPVDALRGDQAAADAVVLVARDGRVEERPVRLGLRTLEAAEVLAGLSAGETILRGSTLRPGSRVRAAIADSTIPTAALPGLRNGTREDAGSAMTSAMGR